MHLENINILFRLTPGKQMVLQAKWLVVLVLVLLAVPRTVSSQARGTDEEFGPVVRAYLGYLNNEQEVVDDRVSRREISASYYRRNSNRIRALRQIAIRLARDSHNDYLPELEAVTPGEFRLLFENPPSPTTLRVGEVIRKTFRYLGSVRSGELFYVFARLDPYEQAELGGTTNNGAKPAESASGGDPKSVSRSRRVTPQKPRDP